jgi:two-component system OmpR family response regulator
MTKLNKKILIVEDDEDFLFIIKKKFTMEGFSIIDAKDGEEGAATAEREKPDLILSDMLMPKMDGEAMAKKIREFNAKVPIIFLTNIKNTDYTADVQKSNNVDYLIKSDTRIDDIVAKAKIKLGI